MGAGTLPDTEATVSSLLWFLAGVCVTGAVVLARKMLADHKSSTSFFDIDDMGWFPTPISERRLRPRPLRSAVDTLPDGKPYRITIVPKDYTPAAALPDWDPQRKPERRMPEGWEDETTPLFDELYREWVNGHKRIPLTVLELGKRSAATRRAQGIRRPNRQTRAQRKRAARVARTATLPKGPAPGRTPVGDRHDL